MKQDVKGQWTKKSGAPLRQSWHPNASQNAKCGNGHNAPPEAFSSILFVSERASGGSKSLDAGSRWEESARTRGAFFKPQYQAGLLGNDAVQTYNGVTLKAFLGSSSEGNSVPSAHFVTRAFSNSKLSRGNACIFIVATVEVRGKCGQVIFALWRIGRVASLGERFVHLFSHNWKTQTP